MTTHTLIQHELGSVKRLCDKPCLCTQVHFKNLIWHFSWPDVQQLIEYVEYLLTPEGFVENQFNTQQTLLLMEEQALSALVTQAELKALFALLDAARIEATRLQLKAQFEGTLP